MYKTRKDLDAHVMIFCPNFPIMTKYVEWFKIEYLYSLKKVIILTV
jgi:hypothetical protein